MVTKERRRQDSERKHANTLTITLVVRRAHTLSVTGKRERQTDLLTPFPYSMHAGRQHTSSDQ